MLFNVLVAIWQFLLTLLFVLLLLLVLHLLHLFLTAAAPHKHDTHSDLDFTFSSRIRWFFQQMYKKCMASHWEFYTIAMTSTKYNSCECIKHRCVQYTFSRMTVTHFDRSKASIYFTYFSFWFFFLYVSVLQLVFVAVQNAKSFVTGKRMTISVPMVFI